MLTPRSLIASGINRPAKLGLSPDYSRHGTYTRTNARDMHETEASVPEEQKPMLNTPAETDSAAAECQAGYTAAPF